MESYMYSSKLRSSLPCVWWQILTHSSIKQDIYSDPWIVTKTISENGFWRLILYHNSVEVISFCHYHFWYMKCRRNLDWQHLLPYFLMKVAKPAGWTRKYFRIWLSSLYEWTHMFFVIFIFYSIPIVINE